MVRLRGKGPALAQQGARDALIEEGRNQVLYLLLAIGDENVAHDHSHPEVAHVLFEARREIVRRLKHPREKGEGVKNTFWPPLKADGTRDWPDFENYSYTPG
mgnify:CR=1 FL=1